MSAQQGMFTISSQYSEHVKMMNAEVRLYMLRQRIYSLESETEVALDCVESDLKRKSDQITRLEETIVSLRNELSAVKDSYLYFNVNDDMDAEERIKYQQQFIEQEIEISNLRESNKQLQCLLDKYRAQTDIQFLEARRLKEGESLYDD